MRPPVDQSSHHFDVYDWESYMPLLAVPPRYALAKVRPLKKSDEFLVAFDSGADRLLAYPIARDRFSPNPIRIAYDDGTAERCLLYDYNINDAQLLLIVERDYVYFFCERYDVHTGLMLQRILVAFPAVFHEPRLAYPHILIAQMPATSSPFVDESHRIFGLNLVLDDPLRVNNRPEIPRQFGWIPAHMPLLGPSVGNFLALVDFGIQRTHFVYTGDFRFRLTEHVKEPISPFCFAPFGLSFLYAHGNDVTLVRFFEGGEIVSR